MGEAADRKVTEIGETRRRLEADLRELDARIPAPLRSVKSLGMLVGGSALGALVLGKVRSKRSNDRSREVVVRVVRDDQ
jgi:hypothetical protein